MRADGLTALCMTDDDATAASGRRIPFAFLEDIHGKFVKTYGRAALTALAYAMNDEFSRVRSIMIDNIDKVLERGDRLEMLVDKTTTMQGNTMRFKRQARRFRNTVWWRNVKLTAAVILILLAIIYIVLAYMCHGFTLPSCVR
ncbi:hypothetical protein ACQJBY_056297 [Aegilops geniculata]|uniref:V-SNARE coiled-coil homology domain-containing protein n=1 Tax=Triticum turgidum subsp. durum TaxID=4567 RepID=A0A9R0Y8V1_TRITD|nr:unnamed protein product [Triticum turgidum subsp. durum]